MVRFVVNVVPDLLFLFSALALLAAAFWRWRIGGRAALGQILPPAGLALFFCLLDYALLLALPRLGLSYGPPRLPMAVLVMLRSLMMLAWIFAPARLRGTRWVLAAGQLLLTAGLVYSFYIEPFQVTVSQIELSAPHLKPGSRVRIVQLADIHVERTGPRERKVVEVVKSLQPDIIVLTGDYLNTSFAYDRQAEQDLRWLVGQLHAPYGVYAVNGTTEMPGTAMLMLLNLNVPVLDNQVRTVTTPAGDLIIAGVSNIDTSTDLQSLTRVAAAIPPDHYSILLYHTPDLIETAAAAGIDLYLTGHTHGGQICLPFYGAVFTVSMYGKRFEQGLYDYNGTQMYVSRGLGMEGQSAPRARFLAPPEVVAVDLVGQ